MITTIVLISNMHVSPHLSSCFGFHDPHRSTAADNWDKQQSQSGRYYSSVVEDVGQVQNPRAPDEEVDEIEVSCKNAVALFFLTTRA